MPIFWGNLFKQFVDGLEESSYIFFKMRKMNSELQRRLCIGPSIDHM